MRKVIQAVVVGCSPADKWPHTDDADFSLFNKPGGRSTYCVDGKEFELVTRNWSTFQPFHLAGVPLTRAFPYRDNATPPGEAVVRATVSELERLAADGVELCLWFYPWHGYADTTECLKRIFKHSAVITMNDYPAGTPNETGRIAHNFNSVVHGNLIWHPNGETTATMFKRLGTESAYYYTQPTSPGLPNALKERNFDLEERLVSIRQGQYKHDVVFVGTQIGDKRVALCAPAVTAALAAAGIRNKIHGWNMRDGDLLPKEAGDVSRWGYSVAAFYLDSFSVLNVPYVALLCMRPYDAWETGTLLIQHDSMNELAPLGIHSGVHYASYSGNIEDLIRKVRYYQDHLDETEVLVRNGWALGRELQAKYNLWASISQMVADHWDKWSG